MLAHPNSGEFTPKWFSVCTIGKLIDMISSTMTEKTHNLVKFGGGGGKDSGGDDKEKEQIWWHDIW